MYGVRDINYGLINFNFKLVRFGLCGNFILMKKQSFLIVKLPIAIWNGTFICIYYE